MKHLANRLAIPAVLCFVGLLLWGEWIRTFSGVLYWAMLIIMAVGMVMVFVQERRSREQNIADNAVAQFKKERGIID